MTDGAEARAGFPGPAASGRAGSRDGEAKAFEEFRGQESTLIALNLAVLAALLVVHVAFSALLGSPSRAVFVAITVFFLLQALELIILQSLPRPLGPRTLVLYTVASVWGKLLFAVLIAVLGGFEHSHYGVLMVLPVVAAAFRFSFRGTLVVVGAATLFTFLELYLYYVGHPPMMLAEFYEASALSLTYIVVAVVVGYLAGRLRRDRQRLATSLAALEEARDRLVKEEKLAAVGRLSSAIAHEIRNPVAMIVSSAGLLKSAGRDDASRQEMEQIILGEAQRLERLASDFLAYARARRPERKATRLRDALDYVASVARARAAESDQRVEVECPEDGEVLVDPFQLQQALLNLLINALDASPPGSTVALGGRLEGSGGLLLTVQNPGAAIPEETRERLFEPFFSTKPSGTGLGLAIARTIARAHGGELWLEANEPGLVRFAIRIPGALAGPGAGED